MADSPVALLSQPLPTEADYDAIYAAIAATGPGRWFLVEYARRSRNTDTTRVIDAMGRIENVIRDGQAREARQNLRIGLLEMARTIAQARADVAEVNSAMAVSGTPAVPTPAAIKTADRLQNMARAMRERGFDLSTCNQISELARTILSVASLHDPNSERARKLGEVLIFLE